MRPFLSPERPGIFGKTELASNRLILILICWKVIAGIEAAVAMLSGSLGCIGERLFTVPADCSTVLSALMSLLLSTAAEPLLSLPGVVNLEGEFDFCFV